MKSYLLYIGKDNQYHVMSCIVKDKSEDGKYSRVKLSKGTCYQILSKYIYPTKDMAEDAAFNYNRLLEF